MLKIRHLNSNINTNKNFMRSKKATKASILKSYVNLAEKAKLDFDFIILTIGAAAICSFGFKMNSPAVIVGAMVISPLLYSVVSIGVASFKKDWKVLLDGLATLTAGIIIAISISAFLNLFFLTEYRTEIVDRLSGLSSDYFFVAFFSGLAGTFTFFWPEIIEAIAGIAISVALIPPVVLIGLGLANFDYQIIVHGSAIVMINVLGIYLGSLLMFTGLHFLSEEK